MEGHRACYLIGERGWLIQRIATEPEVTVRRLMMEAADPRPILFPARAATRHGGAILLGRQHAFF
jgi:hypothetical protein